MQLTHHLYHTYRKQMYTTLIYLVCPAVFIAVIIWVLYTRLVQVINYYQTVNVSMMARCQSLADLTAEIVWRTSATREDKREYRELVKKLNMNDEVPIPKWMRGTFVNPRNCPHCGVVRLRRDKYGGLRICLACTKRK